MADSSVSTKENVKDNAENDFDDLPNDSRASSKRSIGGHQTNTSTHLKHEETIFNGGSTHCHKTFKQNNNAQGLYVSDDDFEIQVNVISNVERLDPTLRTMMRLTLILLMQMSSLLMSQLLLNRWNLMVKR